MNRKEMIRMIAVLEGIGLDLFGYDLVPDERDEWERIEDEQEEYIQDVISRATPDWLDVLLDVYLNPPCRADRVDQLTWELWPNALLGEWGRRDPALVIPKLGALLTKKATRRKIFRAMAKIGLPECLAWLQPYVQNLDNLNEEEIYSLAVAVNACAADPAPLLEHIRLAVRPEMASVHSLIQGFIPRSQK